MKTSLFLLGGFISLLNVYAQNKWVAPSWADTIKNPFANNRALTDSGKAIYVKTCVVCHGTSGKGDGIGAPALATKPADHTSAIVQAQSDGQLFYKLSTGHAPMPSFESTLTLKQRWGLVNYIRTLKRKTIAKSLKNN